MPPGFAPGVCGGALPQRGGAPGGDAPVVWVAPAADGGSSSEDEIGPPLPPQLAGAAAAASSAASSVGAEAEEIEEGPQLPPGFGEGVDFGPSLPGAGEEFGPQLPGSEDEFGPQLPCADGADGAGLGYDPEDLSLQVFDAHAAPDRTRRRPRAPAASTRGDKVEEEEEEGEEEDEMDEEEDGRPPPLPVSHQIALAAHSKAVTCIALDRGGNRLITGSSDSDLFFWDFAGMTRELKPFRHIEGPLGAYQARTAPTPKRPRTRRARRAHRARRVRTSHTRGAHPPTPLPPALATTRPRLA